MTRWTDVARTQAGETYAVAYARRFRELAASGNEINGEALAAAALVPAPARVLDAGCGTGRSTIALSAMGYEVTGVDVDASMLDMARAEAPDLDWRLDDLATLDLGEQFDLVLLAGNIIPLLEPGTLEAVAQSLAAHAHARGLVMVGFGLDAAHLPASCPVTPLADYDAAMAAAGLAVRDRWSTWEGEPFTDDAGYVVTVHAR
ncbi:class I SAM-dependent methyltransferase [Nocardioides humilatus]|uniref:Class I SAM-dependent methyltransferase n=1 Tax=Nocardioides humilatus TaxID=2607660 RepID=A0A5B1LML3_9ACTN|nr:class I SAM-dependent methyltransferase [Nocardioides humilatus]KAA1421764.1 class I SAM-dependent methyltransferase [Nocardioides humilatus]